MKVLITGGAGFVGSSLSLRLRRAHPSWEITAFDNLRRRGAELCLPRLREAGVAFVHGDVRVPDDLHEAGRPELIIECSAEPSVLAGLGSSPAYVVQTNLTGALHCFELARSCDAALMFLSTSRVYPMAGLRALPLREAETRFELDVGDGERGVSQRGISEAFPLEGARSIYGATKLAAELLLTEYVEAYDVPAIIDRCGVLTGPWQMGKVDQGVVMHWVRSHLFGRPLTYLGYGGTGKQVRDVLHVDDLGALVEKQIARLDSWRGDVYNVGGGREVSVSLRELTALAVEVTGREVPIAADPETRVADIPLYLSDTSRVEADFDWAPASSPRAIVEDLARWITDHREAIERTL